MWDATMAENRLIKMGKQCDFECHNMEHQLGAYTNCNHGCGLAVLHPVYYQHIYQEGLPKFVRFAQNVWGIPREGRSDQELGPWPGSAPWRLSSGRSACPPPSRSWGPTRPSCARSPTAAASLRAATKR